MKKFIARTKELATLKRVEQSTQSEFVAIYGRRRVGKTLLVRHYFNNRIAFQLTALANTSTTESQLCLLYTSPSPRDLSTSRMPSSA